jgi:sugar O-acyltransferase (sialic acid O-acetyltransferase NeuD family)
MEDKVFLYGASGHGKVIAEVIQSEGKVVGAVIDDNPNTTRLMSIPVFQTNEFDFSDLYSWIISIGNNSIRKKITQKMALNFTSAIHSSAIVSPTAKIGEGTVVMAGSIVNAEAAIGKHCIINTGAVIEHDSIIADYVHISPNVALAGNVIVGEGAHVGIGAVVIQGVTIGKWVTIGAGSVIIKNVPDYATVVGNPGKIIKISTYE